MFNASTRKLIRKIQVGKSPQGIVATPNGHRIWVANSGDNTVIAFTPGGTRAYVLNTGSNSISVIRTSTLKEISRFNIGSAGSREPYGIAVSTSGRNLFVTMFLDSLLSIAIPSNKIVRRIIFSDETTGAKAPLGIAVRRNRIYMVASANDQAEVRAVPSLKVVTTIQVPHTLESEQGLQEIAVG